MRGCSWKRLSKQKVVNKGDANRINCNNSSNKERMKVTFFRTILLEWKCRLCFTWYIYVQICMYVDMCECVRKALFLDMYIGGYICMYVWVYVFRYNNSINACIVDLQVKWRTHFAKANANTKHKTQKRNKQWNGCCGKQTSQHNSGSSSHQQLVNATRFSCCQSACWLAFTA